MHEDEQLAAIVRKAGIKIRWLPLATVMLCRAPRQHAKRQDCYAAVGFEQDASSEEIIIKYGSLVAGRYALECSAHR